MSELEPINWLRQQAIRMRRTKWPNAWMLADELWLILSSLEPVTTGKITVNPTQDAEDNYTLPPINDIYIPPLDLDYPNGGTYQPVNEQTDTGGQFQNTATTTFWHRSTMPAIVTGEASGYMFPVTVYPNGFLGNLGVNQWREDPQDNIIVDDTARCLGDPDEVEVDDYVIFFHVAQWSKEETTIRDKNTFGIVSQETELTRLQYQNLFIPVSGGGGGTVCMSVSAISALSGLTPGSGAIQRYKLNPDTGDLEVFGAAVTAYSSVRVAVESGKWLQAKKIDGQWWIDVEDCKDNEDGI